MFTRLPGIGLDIGSQKIKLIHIARRKSGVELLKYGSVATPAGAINGGNIVDPESLGMELRHLVKELKLRGKRVVSALGGQQAYLRNFLMPTMAAGEMKEAAYYQAVSFLPFPVEEARVDVYRIREVKGMEGKLSEFFLVAAGKQQIENMKLTCKIAGLRLAVLEVEPQAIFRVVGFEAPVVIMLNIGWTRSYLFVFESGVPVFYRSIAVGSSAFRPAEDLQPASNRQEIEPYWDFSGQMKSIVNEAKIAMEDYCCQHPQVDDSDKTLWLCGGGAIQGLENNLARGLGCEVAPASIYKYLQLGSNVGQVLRKELQQDFVIALGLAARQVY